MGYPFYTFHLWKEFKTTRPASFDGYIGKEKIHCKKVGEFLKEHPEVGGLTENKTSNAWGGFRLRGFRKEGKAYEVQPVSGRITDLETGKEYEHLIEALPEKERQERLC